MSVPSIDVVIVDDDALVRAGLSMILGGASDLRVVAEAGNGRECLRLLSEHDADVVLMDIRMPEMDGLQATEAIAATGGGPKVIVLTTFDADGYVLRALGHGASGFLLKDTPPEQIVSAVRRVAAGEPMLSPSVTEQLIRKATDGGTDEREEQARERLSALTEREREVAAAIGRGRSNAEIASDLHMSIATVKAHVSRVLDKLDATNRVQIALCVRDAGLL